MPPFITNYWRQIAAVVIIVAGVAAFSHSRYKAGERAGMAQVQAQWDVERQAVQRAYDEAAAKTKAQNEHNRKAAEEVEHGLRERVAAADASGRDLARRLHDYESAVARCRALSRAATAPGEPAGTGRESGRDEAIGRATEEVFAACERDATRLDAWEAWAARVYP